MIIHMMNAYLCNFHHVSQYQTCNFPVIGWIEILAGPFFRKTPDEFDDQLISHRTKATS